MEFKKTSRQNRRPRPTASNSAPSYPRPILQSPPTSTPPKTTAIPSKTRPSIISRIQRLRPTKKLSVIGGSVIAGCLIVSVLIYNLSTNSKAETKSPTYQTVLPAGSPISKLGGWKRVSPPGKDPVFAYVDTIDGVAISVSQQPLPQSFKDNVDSQVADLAKKFNATDKIDAGDTKAYIGTSAKGPQSVIFAKDNTLVLIKSQKKISDTSWAKYAASLTSAK